MPMNGRLLRPIQTGFNPRSIAGLRVWYDVANTAAMTFNGSVVSQINDLSGNGFHATQTTANNQPTYSATAANGKPRLAFDTTDSLLSSATVADYFLTPTTNPAFTLVMACYAPPLAELGQVIFGSDSQAGGRVFFASDFGGVSGDAIFDVVNASAGRLRVTVTRPSSSPHIMTWYRHGAVMAWRVDGVTLMSKSDASGNFAVTTARLQIGKVDGGSGNQMFMSEAVVYAAALTSSQIAAAERGLGRKWGIAVA